MKGPLKVLTLLTAILSIAGRSSAQTEKVLYAFTGTNGQAPAGTLVADSAGNLYGATLYGGNPVEQAGIFFQLARPVRPGAPWTENILHSFTGAFDGANPSGKFVVDSVGNLYGETEKGGTFAGGVIEEFSPPLQNRGTWTENVLYNLYEGGGQFPQGGLIQDDAGNLYGVAQQGGEFNHGALFMVSPPFYQGAPWNETLLYSFTGGSDGTIPNGPVVFDQNGNLYGTTKLGGAFNEGTIFRLSPTVSGLWNFASLHDFNGDTGDGISPVVGLVITSTGALVGTTSFGGHDYGIVFGIAPPSTQRGAWTYQILHKFAGGPKDGEQPLANVIVAGGAIYGTTALGGASGSGTVFQLTPPSAAGRPWKSVLLYSFSGGSDGNSPQTGLLLREGTL
jgi:uncharacterized repeat protein (TIGR03803 family)